MTSPDNLAMDSRFKALYAVSAVDDLGPNGEHKDLHGVVTSFAVSENGDLTMLNEVDSGGAKPCYIECAKDGRHVFAANYVGRSVAVFPLDKRILLPASSVVVFPQEYSNAHSFTANPMSDRFLYGCDSGVSHIRPFLLDEATSTIVPNPEQPKVFQNSGPRQIVFYPSGEYCYLVTESAEVLAFGVDKTTGELKYYHAVCTYDKNYKGKVQASSITISKDGRYIYVCNRFRNSIALITTCYQSPVEIKYIEEVWTRGENPRTVTLDPTGRFLYATNEGSNNITRFSIDPNNGRLTFIDEYTPIGSPSQIVFAYNPPL
eukprot:gene157-184_t